MDSRKRQQHRVDAERRLMRTAGFGTPGQYDLHWICLELGVVGALSGSTVRLVAVLFVLVGMLERSIEQALAAYRIHADWRDRRSKRNRKQCRARR
jgi:hypothetical protein